MPLSNAKKQKMLVLANGHQYWNHDAYHHQHQWCCWTIFAAPNHGDQAKGKGDAEPQTFLLATDYCDHDHDYNECCPRTRMVTTTGADQFWWLVRMVDGDWTMSSKQQFWQPTLMLDAYACCQQYQECWPMLNAGDGGGDGGDHKSTNVGQFWLFLLDLPCWWWWMMAGRWQIRIKKNADYSILPNVAAEHWAPTKQFFNQGC